MKRSSKFYSKNEKETLLKLGLVPAPQSGAGWVIKEDGENKTTIVQLKSTDSSSYRINMLDIKKLEYHAEVSNKEPIFLIQFLQSDRIFALVDIGNIDSLYNAFELEQPKKKNNFNFSDNVVQVRKINTSIKARENFHKEEGEKWKKKTNKY